MTEPRIYATLLRADGKESIEIDNIIGQSELKRRMESGDYVPGQYYAINGRKYHSLVFPSAGEWARRCL